MKIFKFITAFLLLVGSASCGKIGLSIVNFQASLYSQKITKNIEFGSLYGSKLDVYAPENVDGLKNKLPVIVFFHGGKWSFGSKNDYLFLAQGFTQLGYIVVIPDYVKYPEVRYPKWQEDAAKALAWAHNSIEKYNGDNENLFVLGHSAGAHIGAILAADKNYLEAEGGNKNWIKAFAGLAGPYHFTPDEDDLKDMFGPPENYKFMQLANYIDGKQAPMLLLWGRDDKDVGEINIDNIKSTLKETGSIYKIKYYDNVDHIDIIAAVSIAARKRASVVSDVDEFFKQNMKVK